MKHDDLLNEYSEKAAEQSRARGSRPPTPAQRKLTGFATQRVMRSDPASSKKIESRRELYERITNANPAIRVSALRRKRNEAER